MGLRTSYDCWWGSCSGFYEWRKRLCSLAGWGDLADYYEERKTWPDKDDVLVELLDHSDTGGELAAAICEPLAARLEGLAPLIANGPADIRIFFYDDTLQFIRGLRAAAAAGRPVEFSS